MPPHHQQTADIYPFPHKDYPERTRFIRNTHRPVDLYESLRVEDTPKVSPEWQWLVWGAVAALAWLGVFFLSRWLFS